MSDKDIREIQQTIMGSGVPGTAMPRYGADGAWGAEGRSALGVLRDAARKCLNIIAPQLELTEVDYADAARMLGASVAQIKAVFEVEATGSGWFTDVRADILERDGPGGFLDGPHLPKILFEAHIFDRETGGRFRVSHPNLSAPRWNRALYVGGQGEYVRLDQAMALDRVAAMRSASWGAPQIMGFNHKLTGYGTVEAFVEAMKSGVRAHLMAFVSFVEASGLTAALRKIDGDPVNARPFASGYNGTGYRANDYDGKIARAFVKWNR